MIKSRPLLINDHGFTILEILVIIVIIFVLAAVLFPHYVDFENQNRIRVVEENMKIVQLAAQAYATIKNGEFPLRPDDPAFKNCFMGGKYPENPFNHKREAPLIGNISSPQQAQQLSSVDLGGSRVAGKIFYSPIVPPEQTAATGYVIQGADGNGNAIVDIRTRAAYILSNSTKP